MPKGTGKGKDKGKGKGTGAKGKGGTTSAGEDVAPTTKLATLKLNSTGLREEDIVALADVLRTTESITSLHISHVEMTSDVMIAMAQAVYASTSLTELEIGPKYPDVLTGYRRWLVQNLEANAKEDSEKKVDVPASWTKVAEATEGNGDE